MKKFDLHIYIKFHSPSSHSSGTLAKCSAVYGPSGTVKMNFVYSGKILAELPAAVIIGTPTVIGDSGIRSIALSSGIQL
jgi:hypothetical protein